MTTRLTPGQVLANATEALNLVTYQQAQRASAQDRPVGAPLEKLVLPYVAARRIAALKAAPGPWKHAAEDLLAMQCVADAKGGMDTARAKRWLRNEAEAFAAVLREWRDGGPV